LHKPSGQAVVTLNGQDVYLGVHGTPQSRRLYDQRVGEWQHRGRCLPPPPDSDGHTIAVLVDSFLEHARRRYRSNDGKIRGEFENYKPALKILVCKYGDSPAEQFGAVALRTVRDEMLSENWSRNYINRQIHRIRNVFSYAVENELIKSMENYVKLLSVKALEINQFGVRESTKVKPVPVAHVEEMLPYVSPQIKAMIRLQLLTGMRPGEVCIMRAKEIDTTGSVWQYRPFQHKNLHHGLDRVIDLGKRAQGIIKPFWRVNLDDFLFQPIESAAWHREQRRIKRNTPLSCGNVAGSNVKAKPMRKPGHVFTEAVYLRTIYRGCDAAFPPPPELTDAQEIKHWHKDHRFHANQLRHTFATDMRKQHGLEITSLLLGHSKMDTSEIYAEGDREKARQIVASVG
jgi:integrase